MFYNDKRKFYILLLVCSILFIGLGYAYLNSKLDINGFSLVKSKNWNIHWQNIEVSPMSVKGSNVIQEATIIDEDKTKIEFSVNLEEPGDFYEFTFEAVNKGEIPAMIDDIKVKTYNSNNEIEMPSYLNYSINCNGKKEEKLKYFRLDINQKHVYRFNLSYAVTEENFVPDSDINLNFVIQIDYSPVDETKQPKASSIEYPVKINGIPLKVTEETKEMIEDRCWQGSYSTSDDVVDFLFVNNQNDSGYAVLKYNNLLDDLDFHINFHFEIDDWSGDYNFIADNCSYNNNFNESMFTYNSKKIRNDNRLLLHDYLEDSLCEQSKSLLMSLDSYCLYEFLYY